MKNYSISCWCPHACPVHGVPVKQPVPMVGPVCNMCGEFYTTIYSSMSGCYCLDCLRARYGSDVFEVYGSGVSSVHPNPLQDGCQDSRQEPLYDADMHWGL